MFYDACDGVSQVSGEPLWKWDEIPDWAFHTWANWNRFAVEYKQFDALDALLQMMSMQRFEIVANRLMEYVNIFKRKFNLDRWLDFINFMEENIEEAARIMSDMHQKWARDVLISGLYYGNNYGPGDIYWTECEKFANDMLDLADIDM